MSNNDNSGKGAEQRREQEQNTEQTPQRPEQEAEREQTTQQDGPQQDKPQTEQRPAQQPNTEKTAFTPSGATLKADEQRQAQQLREGGLKTESKDIDNVN